MLTAKDLRIGNTVNCLHHLNDCPDPKKFNVPVTVEAIREDGITISGSQRIELEYLSGIPLSEDWLLRAGFVRIEKSFFKNIILPYWVNNGVCLFFNESPPENTYLLGIGFNDFDGNYWAATTQWISTVHDLQNFYKEAKGEELTIKENQ